MGTPSLQAKGTRRSGYISTAAILSMLVGCSHRDPPKCFEGESVRGPASAAEATALADGRRRAESCTIRATQCRFSASTLTSGEVLVWVQHADVDAVNSKCMFPVDGDGHFLYSANGEFKERIRSP